ncbi:TetR/AcrR family transcriptional regulator [Zhongshania marina]|uniref:TetR/AcrR family transcriptional regulator n=1 Tax=Zhongshania marina TaxID=2304603 RepID=A0ABX9W331_9GAMM|nr:TetR/AcrR family transcriptional regulator [Zhongshania marina]
MLETERGRRVAGAKKSANNTTPTKVRAKRMSPEARRHQILMCAVDVFASQGIEKATHADIAKLAGVASPTVFHYFPTIDDLQEAVIKEVRRFLLEGFVIVRTDVDAPVHVRVEDMLSSFAKAVDTDKNYVTVWLEWSGSTKGHIWELYKEFYTATTAAIRKLLLEGRADNSIKASLQAADAARTILGMAHTIAHMRFCGATSKTAQKTINSFVAEYISP